MGGILQVDTIQNNNATTLITQTNSTTLTFGVTGQNIVIPSGVTFNTGSATVTLPSTISATTINATTINATTLNSSTLNVTTVVLAAGAVGTPSLTTSGDTNTGIFFPSADTIAFTEGGAEAMRIDSSSRVGIGVTSPNQRLQLPENTNVGFVGGTNNAKIGGIIFGTDSNFSRHGMIDSFRGADAAGIDLRFYTMAGDVEGIKERMRITTAGETLTGGTTDNGAFNLQCNGTGVWGAGAYTNGSDQRIKENIESITSGLDVVQKLNPVTFTYKKDWSKDQNTQTGFIAQELLIALDGKNYINGIIQQGGTNEYYSVAYQNIIPILTKAVQELSAKVDIQQTKIDALEATSTSQQTKIDALEARLTALESN